MKLLDQDKEEDQKISNMTNVDPLERDAWRNKLQTVISRAETLTRTSMLNKYNYEAQDDQFALIESDRMFCVG